MYTVFRRSWFAHLADLSEFAGKLLPNPLFQPVACYLQRSLARKGCVLEHAINRLIRCIQGRAAIEVNPLAGKRVQAGVCSPCSKIPVLLIHYEQVTDPVFGKRANAIAFARREFAAPPARYCNGLERGQRLHAGRTLPARPLASHGGKPAGLACRIRPEAVPMLPSLGPRSSARARQRHTRRHLSAARAATENRGAVLLGSPCDSLLHYPIGPSQQRVPGVRPTATSLCGTRYG